MNILGRRDFLKRAGLGVVGALTFPSLGKSESAGFQGLEKSGGAPPNIVVVLVDDMGFSDLGCYGSEIPTPNLDQLAADGVRFTHFYNTARCSPSRAALLTGLYPHQAGMGFLDGLVKPKGKGTFGRLLPRCVTMAEVLKPAGYFTAITGKWHLGQNHGCVPWERGFMRTLTAPFGEIYFPNQEGLAGGKKLYLNGREVPINSPELGQNWYGPELYTKYGLQFIDEALAEKKPFFLYLAHVAVHFPLMARQEDIARHRGKYLVGWDKLRETRHRKQIALGVVDAKWPLSPRPADVKVWDSLSAEEKDHFDNIMAIYTAIIEAKDRSVGQLVAGLKARGVLDNTLLLFLSDNGGNAESGPNGILEGASPGGPASKVFLGMSWATLANTPFRRYKHFDHEGGISTPLIAHWPAGIPAERNGKLDHQPGHLIDLMATAVNVSGARYPTEFNGHPILPMEGVSLVPAFKGEALPRTQPIFWEHEGNRAIRDGKWKLVMKYKGPWELYDIEADRTEQHNLAAAQPDIAQRLQAAWEAWAARAFVDQWEGPARTDWGEEIKPHAGKKRKTK